jgi:hypothetical protein
LCPYRTPLRDAQTTDTQVSVQVQHDVHEPFGASPPILTVVDPVEIADGKHRE